MAHKLGSILVMLCAACGADSSMTIDAGGAVDVPVVNVDVPVVNVDACAPGLCLDPRCPADSQTTGACTPIGLQCQYFENDLVCGDDGSWACINYDSMQDHCHAFEAAEDAGACITVHPCCGGPAPACVPTDAGGCPPGTTSGQCFDGHTATLGCYVPCVPDPPFCAPAGATCQSECNGGCGMQTATDWYCVCA